MAGTAARGFPAYFDPNAWDEDLARTTAAGREAAEAARRVYQQSGIPFEHLRGVEAEGRDGTVLPDQTPTLQTAGNAVCKERERRDSNPRPPA